MQLREKGESTPLTTKEFQEIMSAMDIGCSKKVAVAVSGGSDSMALTLLLNQWCANQDIHLTALTVDHGLRENSALEAQQVAKWLSVKNISHNILEWQGIKPDTNIQDHARKARYELMGNWCMDNNVDHLFLAHHMNDQAETFLIRLLRGSGVDGLSAMEKSTIFPFNKMSNKTLKILRPLLEVESGRLLETIQAANQDHIEDPSNLDEKYTRIQIRSLLNETEIEGLNAHKLSSTSTRMRRVRSLLEEMTSKAESDFVSYNSFGYASIVKNNISELHEEIGLRLLSKVIKTVGGNTYAPRHKSLEKLFENLKETKFPGQSLAGVLVFTLTGHEIVITRETKNIDEHVNVTEVKQNLWDNRFEINSIDVTGVIEPLNSKLLKSLSLEMPDFKLKLADVFSNHLIRDRVLPSLPCIVKSTGEILLPEFLGNKIGSSETKTFSAIFHH